MASVITDVGLMDMIHARLGPDAQDVMPPGDAVAGLLLKGVGLAHRPLSLTPPFVANTPLDLWCREGLRADMVNRFQRGRILDAAYAYGGDLWCQALALAVCAHDGIDGRCTHLDTTRFARRGDDVPAREEPALRLTHGYSKEHRPDLTPAVLARLVSQDGGVPCVRNSWDGHTSDTPIFHARAQAFMRAVKTSPRPRSLRADATLSPEDNAAHLHGVGCITRLATTISVVSHVIAPALRGDTWHTCDATTRDQGVARCHYGMAQRWLVVSSHAARARAEAPGHHATPRDDATLDKPRVQLHAQRFSTPEAAQDALATLTTGWRSHHLASATLIAPHRSAAQGRPTPNPPRNDPPWHMQAPVRPAEAAIGHRKPRKAWVVLGTHSDPIALSDTAIMAASKRPARVDGGGRLLNDPRWLVSALVVTTPCRLQGLLRVMT
jgi:hypothetical protein